MEKPHLGYIKELSEGDIAFEEKLLFILKKELPEEYDEFTKNFAKKDFLKTAENVHKLKHKISILGLEKGYEEAELFERDLKEKRTQRHESFTKTIEVMIDFLATL